MNSVISKRAKAIAWLLTLVYFASYLMRKNFSVMLVDICGELAVEKSAIAIVSTLMTITYGAGQIINGILGDRIKPQTMLTTGLGLAAACNVAMFFAPNIPVMAAIWAVNGYAHAMLWPPIVRLMSMHLNSDEYGYSAVRVSWGSSIATIVLYTLCPFLLMVTDWRTVIIGCAVGGVAILALWVSFQKKVFADPSSVGGAVPAEAKAGGAKKKGIPLPLYVFIPIALIMLGIVLQGMLRDGVTDWTPNFLHETYGVDKSNAILFTVIPAIFSMISFSAFDLLHRKVFRNEVTCSAVIFGGAAVCSLILFAFNTLIPNIVVAIVAVSLIIGCMHGINLMLITVVPKRFIKSGKVSTFSGILNACTYGGSAIAVPGFAMITEMSGNDWNVTVLVWGIISVLGLAVCLAGVPLWRKFCKEYAN